MQTEQLQYDVVILGGGPAGAATALSLRKHAPELSVALIEQSNYAENRIGETLPPPARGLLEQLEVWPAFLKDEHLPAFGTCAAWGSDTLYDNEFIFNMAGRGWHLDRKRFDAGLAREAERCGAALFSGYTFTRSRLIQPGGLRRLTVQSKDRRKLSIEAAFVVDATGRRAVFARQQQIRKVILDQMFGVFVFFDLNKAVPLTDTYTLVEAFEEGWWYSALLPEQKLVVVCMGDVETIRKRRLNSLSEWLELMRQTNHTKGRGERGTPLGAPLVRPAYSHRLESLTGDGWLAVGDAATTFDPLSSQGILKGLRSGILASYAIGDHFKGLASGLEKFEALLSREFEDYLGTRAEFYRQEQRWTDSVFWRRRYDYITIDPDQILHSDKAAAGSFSFKKPAMHLSVPQLKSLCKICSVPRPAREVVSEFTARQNPTPARRVILALQYLVEADIIHVTS